MKKIATIILLLAVPLAASAQTKRQTLKEREEAFRQEIATAKWVLFTRTDEGEPYYINSLTMSRFMSTVIFTTKREKRGTIEYGKIVGGCTKDLIAVSINMMQNPGMKELIGGEIEEPEMTTAEKGTIGYAMLDYVCKNAKVMEVK